MICPICDAEVTEQQVQDREITIWVTKDISADRVIIEKSEGGKIVIENPSVVKISAKGQDSFQISGEVSEQTEISDSDVKTVKEQGR